MVNIGLHNVCYILIHVIIRTNAMWSTPVVKHHEWRQYWRY